jgi:hypothetical protein
MKFYRDTYNYFYDSKIYNNKLTAVYCKKYIVIFSKNGIWHNNKNASYIEYSGYRQFYLNGKFYGDQDGNQNDFTKKSWRKFIKLQAFL